MSDKQHDDLAERIQDFVNTGITLETDDMCWNAGITILDAMLIINMVSEALGLEDK